MLNRHVSTREWFIGSPTRLCGASGTSFLFFDQQSCDDHEVIRKHGGSHQKFESLATLGEATLHPTAAEQNGDATLDAGTKALSTFEGWAFLVRFLCWRFPPAPLGNTNKLDPGTFALLNIVLAEESPIGTVDAGCITRMFPGDASKRIRRGRHPWDSRQARGIE